MIPRRVALFVTCLVDVFRPSVGFAAVKLLEDAGCTVAVPVQTCCGQPAWNSGARRDAAALARAVVDAFEGYEHVVAPSGSCAGMLRRHYPELLADDPAYAARASALAQKTHELTSFLVDVLGVTTLAPQLRGPVAYHDSCSSLREMKVRDQPRALLTAAGIAVTEMENRDVCCGFGGTFAVKYGEISGEIARKKCAAVTATGAGTLLAGDLGCLLHLAGKLKREGSAIELRHVAEVLAGMTGTPAIGES